VALDAARRKARVRRAQRVALPQVPPAQSSQPVLAHLVLQSEAPVRELRLAEALQAHASQPQVPQQPVQPEPPQVLGPLASRRLAGGPAQPEKQ